MKHPAILLALVTLSLACQDASQSVPLLRLTQPEAVFAEGFTQISGIRWLSDGRVLLADAQERRVQLLDRALRGAVPVAREGAGPGEFAIPRRLFALRGDSSLLHDPGNARYLVIHATGKPGSTVSIESNVPAGATAVRGVDADGRFYFQVRRNDEAAAFGTAGSEELVVRSARNTSQVDTLATLAVPAGREEGSMSAGPGLLRLLTNRPLAGEDIALVSPDGLVAIVRAQPYHIEWISPGGQRIVGPAISYDRLRVTAAEKRAFLESRVVPGQIVVQRGTGDRAAPLPRSRGPRSTGNRPLPPGFDEASMKWPSHKPPFLAGAALIATDGRLWVLRTRAATDAIPHYDVFDRSGRLVMRVDLPAERRIAGFGAGVVFVDRTDENDLHYLERYPLPK